MRWIAAVIASLLVLGCKDKDKGTDTVQAPPAPTPVVAVPQVELPKLVGFGTVPIPAESPVLAGSLTGLTLDGTAVIALRDGAIAAEDLDGGAQGIKLLRVTDALAARAKVAAPSTLAVALDHRLTYRVLLSVLFSAKEKEAGWKRFALLAQAGDRTVALPITLPDMRPASAPAHDLGAALARQTGATARVGLGSAAATEPPPSEPSEPPLQLFVTITANDLILWSASELEGSLRSPKLRVARADTAAVTKLGAALAEIVQRRWAGKQRPEGTREIVLQAEAATPLQLVTEVMEAVRATPKGEVLFPDVTLSRGFE